jgi:HSP20 family molecular chaperone IbpA
MSQVVPSQSTTSSAIQQQQQQGSQSAASYSYSSSSSYSASSSASSSASKTVKQTSTTTVKQSSSIVSASSKMSSSLQAINVKSSGIKYSDKLALDLGIADINKEMDRLQLRLGDEMATAHRDIFKLMPGSPVISGALESGSTSAVSTSTTADSLLDQFLVKLDSDAIRSCIDKSHDDRVKLNFDVNEYDSETINIRTVGNKIEVHAMKKSKKGDEERSEEFSRVYELPNEDQINPAHVTSSIYQDGVLTIELPISDALGSTIAVTK